ncbi:MAG: C25 family cysteine peptidase [Candidatus Thorarchaeota archaeon]
MDDFRFHARVEESRLKKFGLQTREICKLLAIAISAMIVVSSIAIIQVGIPGGTDSIAESNSIYPTYRIRPCELTTNTSTPIPWVHFDDSSPGTLTEVHVTVSDTTGITIVADFHGFWRSNYTNGTTIYDDLIMPGASSMREPGVPMLPVLTELIEIPHDIDVSIEIVSSSNDTGSNYDIRPVPEIYYPVGFGEDASTNATPILPDFLGSIYNQDVLFPGSIVNTAGEAGDAPSIIRDHRLLELCFYPVQYNPMRRNITAFSQIVVKLKYSEPAQIRPIRESLRSEIFERILKNSLLNYDECHERYKRDGSYYRWPPTYSEPNATVPYFKSEALDNLEDGAEYLIITSDTFQAQAQRLADWKQRKGITSRVLTIREDEDVSRLDMIENIKGEIEYIYENWFPVPTYVVLFGDVDTIPTIAGMEHPGYYTPGVKMFPEEGHFATDLYYFAVQGTRFYPDIIYSRMSVDTVEQAEIMVNRTIMYEQAPQVDDSFYENILQSGYFQDKPPYRDGTEDRGAPFIYHLENIRDYLKDLYNVHINYSSAALKKEPIKVRAPVGDPPSNLVADFLGDYEWLVGFDTDIAREDGAKNISANINDGRFLVMYYGHGGSKNMKYSVFVNFSSDNRDVVEGWHTPWFNASEFNRLNNENMTPLVLSIACSSGWFDGETDQDYCTLTHSQRQISDDIFETYYLGGDAFEMYDGECFAENITRLAGGGAIAVIAPSRAVPSLISGDLLKEMIQSFWPGFMETRSQPIYEIGGAFFAARVEAAEGYTDIYTQRDIAQQMYEGFHLFGDPETQLWTDVPSEFNVTHPKIIGSQSSQEFAVTVSDLLSKEPIINAKVCIQQGAAVYDVEYTDVNGQVVFNVNPHDRDWTINVTVTKHNYRPYLGEIDVEMSEEASVDVYPTAVVGGIGESVTLELTGFNPQMGFDVYFNDKPVYVERYSVEVPEGSEGFVNIRVEQEGIVVTTQFYRLSSLQNPDPYIYSQYDDSTWDLAHSDEPVWDNPCINIYRNGRLVDHLEQNTEYDVNVTVWNRGNGDAVGTAVTLWYAPFGGGVTWHEVIQNQESGTLFVDIPLLENRNVTFKWTPELPNTACLNVTIFHGNELQEHRINNIGVECWHVFPLCSIGESEDFEIGNPSEKDDYVSISVRQKGDEDDVWSASIDGYTSQSLEPDDSEDAKLVVDPERDLHRGESRSFTAEMYVDDELILGIQFDGTCANPMFFVILILMVVIVVIFAIAYFASSNRSRFVEILIILALLGVVILEVVVLLDWLMITDYIPYIGNAGG